jgi:pilus assembly protein Flp/PilA
MKSLKETYEGLCIKLFTVLRSEKGQGLVEYALLLVLIAVVVIIMLRGTGREVNGLWSRINSGINQ